MVGGGYHVHIQLLRCRQKILVAIAGSSSKTRRMSERLQLLIGGLGAAIPRLGQARDGLAGIGAVETRRLAAGCGMRETPNLAERLRPRSAFRSHGGSLHLPLQRVHASVGMAPRITQKVRVE